MKPTWIENLRYAIWLALPVLATAVAGCADAVLPTSAGLNVWAASEMVDLTDQAEASLGDVVYDAQDGAVNLFAAANETVAFQVVLDAGDAVLSETTIEVSDLEGPDGTILPAERIELFRMWPVEVTRYPAWYLRLSHRPAMPTQFYDALIPTGAPVRGMPYSLAPGERLAFWVDLHVPRGVRAGTYSGAITLKARHGRPTAGRKTGLPGGRTRRTTLKIQLKVHDFVLPDSRPVLALGGFDQSMLLRRYLTRNGKPYSPLWMDRQDPLVARGLVVIRQLMTLARAHRLDLFDKSLRPSVKRDMDGKLKIYWGDYDAVIKPYLDGTAFADRVGSPAWPMWTDDRFSPEKITYNTGSKGTGARRVNPEAIYLIDQTVKHFQEMGFANRLFAWPIRDTAGAEHYRDFSTVARVFRKAAPHLPILTQLPPAPPAPMGWRPPSDYRQLYDMLAPPAHLLDPGQQKLFVRAASPLRGAYLAPGAPPFMPPLEVVASAADVRAVPWMIYRYGLNGLFIPDVLEWGDDPFTGGGRSETRLFYPGRFAGLEAVLPSVRLKRLRRGLQDLTYLALLRQRGRGAVADRLARAMARYLGLDATGDHYLDPRLNGWVADAASWELARKLMVSEVRSAIWPGPETTEHLRAQRMTWRQLDQTARSVRIERIRSRVRESDTGFLHANVQIDLYNERGGPAAVRLTLPEPPEGIQRVNGTVDIPAIAPGERKSVELSFTCRRPHTNAAGALAVPIHLSVEGEEPSLHWAHVKMLVSTPPRKPLAIDGDLTDWPMRPGNSAGNFRLLGRRGRYGKGLAKMRTLAFVMHDEKNLYLAFRCNRSGKTPLVVKATNTVRYEQLLAAGEDMVEVIFDPAGLGKAAEDLYRIVVKANGILITERGVPSEPPLGAVAHWPAAARVAVKQYEKVWIVELAVPLSAFGPAGRQRRWGVNFVRYTTESGESSSWSGTPRHYYDPANLGTVFLMPTADKAPR